MKIASVKLGRISVPLKRPFKTALRTVESVEDIIVEVHSDTGEIGYGEAAPTGVITGDTTGAIIGAIQDHISKAVIGMDISDIEDICARIETSCVHNTSAKAAVDIAVHDLWGKNLGAPLHKLLGGSRSEIVTDITISVNEPEHMAADAEDAVKLGYRTLKIKLGKEPARDIERIKLIRERIGFDTQIRVDANQGWKPKEAVRIINSMDAAGLMLEFVEQPVAAADIEGLKFVTDHVSIPVMADEAVFSPADAERIMETGAADMVNIKLMKAGGIHNALKICALAEVHGIECMVGCMLEAKASVSAAVSLAAAKKVITKIDLDGPVLCSEDPVQGGAVFKESIIHPNSGPGIGISGIEGISYL